MTPAALSRGGSFCFEEAAMLVLSVAVGGAIGATLRHFVNVLVVSSFGVPSYYATFVVNVVGCTVAGCLLGLAAQAWSPSETMRAFVFVGIMGGFTTFSAFSADSILLMERAAWGPAAAYVLGSVVLSLAGFFVGLRAMRIILGS
jgi:CrcB protein